MFDVESFVSRNFDDMSTYGNPISDIRVNCPFCITRYGSDDMKHKLFISINPDKQVVHCFRCGYKSSWIGFVQGMTGMDYIQAYGELYVVPSPAKIESVFVEPTEITKSKEHVALPDDFRSFNNPEYLPSPAINYMRNRGFSIGQMRRYNIGVAPSIPWRIIIPIEDGYWQARSMMTSIKPKYINPKVSAHRYLFNSQALDKYDEIVITEGAFSAMAIGYNAVAIIGKDCTDEKMKRFVGSDAKRFIIAIEPGAFPTMRKLADKLYNSGKGVTIWNYGKGDPADKQAEFEIYKYNMKTKMKLLLD